MWPVASPIGAGDELADRRGQRPRGRDGLVSVAGVDAQPGEARRRGGDPVAEQRCRGARRRPPRPWSGRWRPARTRHRPRCADAVLYGEHEVLLDRAEAEAEHDHEAADQPQRGVRVDRAQQRHADARAPRAADEVALPATGAADQPAGHDAGHQQAEHQRQSTSGRPWSGTVRGRAGSTARGTASTPNIDHADHHAGDDSEGDRAVGKRCSGMIGSAARDSTYTAATRASRPGGDHQGAWSPTPSRSCLPASETHDQQDRDAAGDQEGAGVVDRRPCASPWAGAGCAGVRRTRRPRTARPRRSTSASPASGCRRSGRRSAGR